MRKIPLGRTGLDVSEICLGSMTWGSQNTEAESHAQIDCAVERGVNFIDTAEMYPTNPLRAETVGVTEEIIGNWLKAGGKRDQMVIATKITGEGTAVIKDGPPISRKRMIDAVDGSLRRLKTDVIDLYQLHWPNRGSYHFRQNWRFDPSGQRRPETVAHMMEVLETAQELVTAGKIRHLGLSNESAWGAAMWLRLADENALPRIQAIQNEYSLLCRLFDTDLAELSVNEDLPLLGYSPLAAGLLSGKYAGDVIPEGSRRAVHESLGGRITPRVWSAVSACMGIANEAGLDPCKMAIAWFRTRPFPAIPIIGATSPSQLDTLLGAADLSLSEDVVAALNTAWKQHPMPF